VSNAKNALQTLRNAVAEIDEVQPHELGTDDELAATLTGYTNDKYTAEQGWTELWDTVGLVITNEGSYADKAAFIAGLQAAIEPYDPTA
jgi:hypothetical protein